MMQHAWELFVQLYVGGLIIPALHHPIEATFAMLTLMLTAAVCCE
jgi:hypothetical protein